MNIFGWFIAFCGFAGIVFGIRMMLKQKKMGNVPFKKPSEIAQQGDQAGDARGMVSTEGVAQLAPQPLVAPMSGQPCIAYEIVIERKWEKYVKGQKGMEKRTGSTNVFSEFRGSVFAIGDGQGSVFVDATKKPDSEYEKSHSSTFDIGMMIPGTLAFGQMQMNTPAVVDLEGRTLGFIGSEKILKPSPTMYALGQLQPGPQGGLALATPKGITTGSLIVHHQGREKLLGKTKRNMVLGYAIGGVLFVAGIPMGILGGNSSASAATASATTTSEVPVTNAAVTAPAPSPEPPAHHETPVAAAHPAAATPAPTHPGASTHPAPKHK
jgi:hypothetical protein